MVRTTHHRPLAIDLFAGAGGLSLGLEQAGFDVVGAVEIDPVHAATHEANFPHTKVLCQDVRELTGATIRQACGVGRASLDLVAGGPPCQGFSLIGKRILEDPRNSLVQHFQRIVLELRPRTFVMENVPGMASGGHTQLLEELIAGFEAGGYQVRRPYELLNAARYGVPQNRTRLFLLGSRGRTTLPEYPEPTTRPPPSARTLGKATREIDLPPCPTAEEALGDLPDIEAARSHTDGDFRPWKLRGGSTYAKQLRGDVLDPTDHSRPRAGQGTGITGCQTAQHTDLSRTRFRETPPGTTEPVSRFFRLAADGISNTLRAGTATDRGAYTAPRPIHFRYARCISVREAARLHSYPDWFRFHETIWHGFRQIGNSVPPLLGRAVGASVLAALGHAPTKPRQVQPLGAPHLTRMAMHEAAAHFGVSAHAIARRRRAALPADEGA